ncbi:putative FtsX-related transmembrane transport protein [Indibacter alkaliphilus LW1]|uniref:FtsX-related transmembrane transport protein n=1 Tax=Indibacter alkaliphilus (strain CCUG 57479 / KCTC 22604 / LW1) TaxID=1189612 RepID=S2E8W2_INDAL|nr:FtsX-like permease family protein [Indibacter alkaliphilus]EOZ98753.1 putative FtsX-related transmembrane transport protein [Indibacter alkaliphilus LW1]
MLKNYFTIALRNIKRNKLRTLVHVLGLSLGMAVCLLVFNVVWFAHGFDTFHDHADRIYRINSSIEWEPGSFFQSSATPGPLGEVVDEELANIFQKGRLYILHETMVSIPEQNRQLGRSNKVAFADPGFMQIFQREWLAGDPYTALNEPESAVITVASMEKYFPGSAPHDVLGKEILWLDANDSIMAQVKGVVRDYDQKTDFFFQDFISFSTIKKKGKEDWYGLQSWGNLNTSSQLFVLVAEHTGKSEIEEGLKTISDKYYAEDANSKNEFFAEPLANFHFNENFDNTAVSRSMLDGLIYIGFIILLLACLNFINLETAQAINRAKEVGIRKTLGSRRGQLIFQFLSETFAIVLISGFVAILFADLITQYFREYLPQGFEPSYFNSLSLVFLFVLMLLLTFVSGLYPAFVLAKYQPQRALKGEVHHVQGFSVGVFLRKNLTVIQFSASIAFIILVTVLTSQLKFIKSQPLGFEKDAVLYTNLPFMGERDTRETFADRLRNENFVEGVSLSGVLVSSNSIWTSDLIVPRDTSETRINIHVMNVDSSFVDVHQLKLLAGRKSNNQKDELLVNRNFLHEAGFGNPSEAVGTIVRFGGDNKTIVGVIDNFNARSLKEEIMPMALTYNPDYFYLLITKVSGKQNMAYAKERLENLYKEMYPEETASFSFMDEQLAQFYEEDRKIQGVFGFASGMAILISILGLFGLSSFTIAQRTKEISIRKVLGAGVLQLIGLISTQYVWLVLISFALAVYPAYYLSNMWLQEFAYKIEMPFLMYLGVGFGVLILALLVVGFHSIGVAKRNPAEILKSE